MFALALIAVLAVVDVLTTLEALRNPRLREANGLVAWLMRLGPVWILIKLAVTAGGLWLLRDQANPVNVWFAWGAAAIYATVVINNARLAR